MNNFPQLLNCGLAAVTVAAAFYVHFKPVRVVVNFLISKTLLIYAILTNESEDANGS